MAAVQKGSRNQYQGLLAVWVQLRVASWWHEQWLQHSTPLGEI